MLDDDEDDQLIFASTIQSRFNGCDFFAFFNYSDTLEFLKNHSSANLTLFLDLNMPKVNGIEVLRDLRSQNQFRELTIIIYSTSYNPKDINDCLIAGANAFITKQSRISDLVEEIKPYLEVNSVVQ